MAAKIPAKVGKIVDVFVSVAAAIVIWGALRKILHSPDADLWLKIGLTTEALVFLAYGILYIYYPAMDDHEVHIPGLKKANEVTPLQTMEKMLEEADITPANLGKLSAGFQKLGSTVEKMGEVSDVVKSTGDFGAKAKDASVAMAAIASSVNAAAGNSFNAASETTKQFHTQVQVLAKNLSSLNTVYELELQESNNHLKTMNQFYGKLAQTTAAMSNSTEDAIKAKEQITVLAGNLTKLNSVYGSMLTAMQGRQA
jgi:gliding motility-associated protein GldL